MTSLATALGYVARGWCPIPIPHMQKGPKLKGLARVAYHRQECTGLLQWRCPERRRGPRPLLRRTGGCRPRLPAGSAHREFGPPGHRRRIRRCRASPGRTGSIPWARSMPRRANSGRSAGASEKLLDPTDGATLVELRGDPIDPDKGPLQMVFPGSTHPSGEAIEWAEDGDLAVIREVELRRHVRELAAVALIAKHWPAGPHKDTDGAAVAGGRHDANLKVAGWLTRCGWSPDRVARSLELVSIAAGADPEKAKRRALGSEAAVRAQTGDRLYGWLCGRRAVLGQTCNRPVLLNGWI